MKTFFLDIWSDIRQRKNIELYLTLVIIVVVLMADIFGVDTEFALLEIVLATLAVLLLAIIENRHSNERLETMIDDTFQENIEVWNQYKELVGNIANSGLSDLVSTDSFIPALQGMFIGKNEIDSIDIFAHIGNWYHDQFKLSGLTVNRMRILLRDMEDFRTMNFPSTKIEKEKCKNEQLIAISSFEKLQQAKRIKNLEIAFYPFDSINHFMIVDHKVLFFGLYKPLKVHPGAEAGAGFSVQKVTNRGIKLITEFSSEFDVIWQNFGKPQKPSKNEKEPTDAPHR